MKNCSRCGKNDNPDDAAFCEKCGAPLASGGGKWLKVAVAVILLALLAIGGCYFFDISISPKRASDQGAASGKGAPPAARYTPREDVWQSVRDSGVLRVAVESKSKPFNWIDETTGQPTGFEYDLVRLVAAQMGLRNVTMVYTSDYEDIPNLISKERGKADVFMGGYVASPDIPNVVWSDPYYAENGYCLIVPSGSAIKTLADLRGKKVGVYDEDAAEAFVRENVPSPAGVSRFVDEDEDSRWIMNHLLSDQARRTNRELVDAIVYDYVFAKEEIKAAEGRVKIAAFNLNQVAYQMGLPRDNYELEVNVNRALRQVMETPQYAQLVKKYLDFDDTYVSLPAIGGDVRTHTVRAGETLSVIARAELGDTDRWPELWEANKSRVPNPHLIHVGDKIIVP